MTTETEREALKEWCDAGGSHHGPNVETVTMPLALYVKFRAALDQRQAFVVTDEIAHGPFGNFYTCPTCKGVGRVDESTQLTAVDVTDEIVDTALRIYEEKQECTPCSLTRDWDCMKAAILSVANPVKMLDGVPRRLPKESHSCVYTNDGKCRECDDLAELELIRRRIEQAIVEHCSGHDLWLCSHLAANHVWTMRAALQSVAQPVEVPDGWDKHHAHPVKVGGCKYTFSETLGHVYELYWLHSYNNKPRCDIDLYMLAAAPEYKP